MGLTDKAKELADVALQKAGELSEVAREKAPGYLDRAADLAVKAADAAAGGVDRATGGRFHDKLEEVTAKVEQSLDRPRAADGPTGTAAEPDAAAPPTGTTGTAPTAGAAGTTDLAGPAGTASEPITPASTNPEATDPDGPTRTP
jgi:hypothetical protein